MKDVSRRPDGWTVHIKLGDAIAITHKRWEQNLSPEKASNAMHAFRVESHVSFFLRFVLSGP